MTNQQALDRVTAARIQVLQTSPFYGLAAMRFQLVEDEAHPDMWTDGSSLGYNPKWALGCSFDELKGTIAHCAHHCALAHHLRRESRDEKLWNQSTDRVVNVAMRDAGFSLPKGVKVQSGDSERSAEEIYDVLNARRGPTNPREKGEGKNKDENENQDGPEGFPGLPNDKSGDNSDKGKNKGKGKGDGNGEPSDSKSESDQPGECKDAKNDDGSSLSQSQQDQKIQEQLQDTAALAQQAKSMGDLPGSIARQVQELLYPQQDWAQQLREFMLSLSTDDYSWNRPNRRFIGQGLYLPSLQTEGRMGRIVVAIDTSGSISKHKLDQFFHEFNGILEQCRPDSVSVIYCDYEISDVQEFTADAYPIELGAITGGGGTDLRPPFQYVADNNLSPDCFLYFTDLDGRWPESDPGYPVVWIDQDNWISRFGEQYGYRMPSFGKMIGISGNN